MTRLSILQTRLSTLKTWLESQVFRPECRVFKVEFLVIVQETQVILGHIRSFHKAKKSGSLNGQKVPGHWARTTSAWTTPSIEYFLGPNCVPSGPKFGRTCPLGPKLGPLGLNFPPGLLDPCDVVHVAPPPAAAALRKLGGLTPPASSELLLLGGGQRGPHHKGREGLGEN